MTVAELKMILNKYPDDLDIITKKTEIFGTIGLINSVRQDTYRYFGEDIPCLLLTDEGIRDKEEIEECNSFDIPCLNDEYWLDKCTRFIHRKEG